MSFFDIPRPPDDDDVDASDELGPGEPGRWLGGVVAVEEFVGRSDKAAVAVRRITAYEDGFELDVVAWIRRRSRPRRGHFHREILLYAHGGFRDDNGNIVPELVRVGFQYPDGGKATNIDERRSLSADATEPGHGMSSRGGSSSGSCSEQTFWVWPVPDAGDVVMVCEWPAQDIPESRLVIDGDVLRSAAARSVPVWPDEPRRSHISLEERVRVAQTRAFSRSTSAAPSHRVHRAQRAEQDGPAPDASEQGS